MRFHEREGGTASRATAGNPRVGQRVILINRYFYPDRSATGQMLSDLAFFLAGQGCDVHVIAGAGAYDDPALVFPGREEIAGVTIRRIATGRARPRSLSARARSYLSLYRGFALEAFRHSRAGDILVVKTDPPLLSCALWPVAKLKRLKQVNWLQDLYPEVAVALGVAGLRGPIGRALARLRNASLRGAALNVAIGESMRARLLSLNVPLKKTCVIANWCDDWAIVPRPAASNPLREAWGLADKFVVGYSGNLGRAHDYRTLLGAAAILHDQRDIVFLFIGGGQQIERLRDEAAALGLAAQFQFHPYQDAALLPQSLCAPDIHWLSLMPELEGLIVPSKFYGIAAAARPMIAVMQSEGEIARLVRRFDCGAVIAPGDSEGFARTILAWREDRDRLATMGRNARALLDGDFRKRDSLQAWHRALTAIGHNALVGTAVEEINV